MRGAGLTDDTDRKWFDDLMQSKLKQHLRVDMGAEEFGELMSARTAGTGRGGVGCGGSGVCRRWRKVL